MSRVLLALSLLVGGASAFTAPASSRWLAQARGARLAKSEPLTSLRAEEEDSETESPKASNRPSLKTSRESLIYDENRGGFSEQAADLLCREEFCAIDEATGKPIVLTVEEKERIFTDALQAYYFDGRETLNDRDFDQLKEDLMWEGSPLAILSRDETKFLSAMSSYLKGKPIMSDEEFDKLKAKLKANGSEIAVSKKPKCFIDTGICSVTWTKDNVRQAVAYLPVALVVSIVWVVLAFELTPLRYVNPIVTLLLGVPVILGGTVLGAENFFYKNPLIASGPCPECGETNRIFFGDVLTVKGLGDEGKIKCQSCSTELTIARSSLRVSTPAKF